MARGGRRAGTPGKSYANRSDLNVVRKLPVTTAPGQAYGDATAQAQAQSAVPMASGDLTTAPQLSHQDLMQQAQSYNPPNVVPLSSPSLRPGEPLMTPPAPQPAASPLLLQGVALLNSLGASASPEVKALRNVVSGMQANEAAP